MNTLCIQFLVYDPRYFFISFNRTDVRANSLTPFPSSYCHPTNSEAGGALREQHSHPWGISQEILLMSHTEHGEHPCIGQQSPYFDDDCMNKILDIPAWQPQARPEAYPPAQSRLLDHDTPGITTGCWTSIICFK